MISIDDDDVEEINEVGLKHIRTIRIVAVVFLGIQTMLLVSWAINLNTAWTTVMRDEEREAKMLSLFFVYIMVFWLLNLSIVVKRNMATSIQRQKLKLLAIAGFVILPTILLMIHTVYAG